MPDMKYPGDKYPRGNYPQDRYSGVGSPQDRHPGVDNARGRVPGVYVEEIPALKPIQGVPTTTAAFLGFASAGRVGVPTEVDSWQGFCREFAPEGAEPTEPHSLPMHMPHAVRGYFENGGNKAVVLRLDEDCAGPAQYLQELARLDSVPDISMIVTPETQDEQVVEAVLSWVTERKQAVYLFDAPARAGMPELRDYAARFASDYGALYYPWLKIGDVAVPSAGHVAGVIARTDLSSSVYKAPAGTRAAVLGITGVSRTISAREREQLRETRVNWIGSSRGSPIALQGVLTTGESYLNIRRALIYLERSLARGLQQLAFDKCEPGTWVKAAELAEDFLFSEFRRGGLQGRKPKEAYFVQCDATTHGPRDIEQGRLLILAGVALLRPAEFEVIRIEIRVSPAEPPAPSG
jgi:phage tail sheath protein FI